MSITSNFKFYKLKFFFINIQDMDPLRSKINKYVDHRTQLDKDMFRSFEMRNDCLRELEKFTPRTKEEKETKLRYIRKFQVALVENRTAGNIKFYTRYDKK